MNTEDLSNLLSGIGAQTMDLGPIVAAMVSAAERNEVRGQVSGTSDAIVIAIDGVDEIHTPVDNASARLRMLLARLAAVFAASSPYGGSGVARRETAQGKPVQIKLEFKNTQADHWFVMTPQ